MVTKASKRGLLLALAPMPGSRAQAAKGRPVFDLEHARAPRSRLTRFEISGALLIGLPFNAGSSHACEECVAASSERR